jgi:hypothetical protein
MHTLCQFVEELIELLSGVVQFDEHLRAIIRVSISRVSDYG